MEPALRHRVCPDARSTTDGGRQIIVLINATGSRHALEQIGDERQAARRIVALPGTQSPPITAGESCAGRVSLE